MKTSLGMETKKYESLLPYGYKSIVAKRAGVTPQTVTAFFSGRSKNKRVEDSILDILSELREKREDKLKKAGIL